MKHSLRNMTLAALVGAVPAVLGGLGGMLPDWEGINAPFRLLGSGLRALSLSGFVGNAAAWAVVLAVSVLPLLLLRKGRMGGWEDILLLLSAPVLLVGQYFLVNPTRLNTPLREMFPLTAAQTALSLLAAWWLLKWLRGLRAKEDRGLTAAFRRLFRVCAFLLVAAAAYGQFTALLADWERVARGNTGTGSLWLTYAVLVLLSALRFIPDLLAGLALLWGGELAGELDGGFDAVRVELCRSAASACAQSAQITVVAAAAVNLLQLLLVEKLRDASFVLEIPLLTLALSAGLFLLCRILERGRQLQEDSDSII